MGGSPRLRPVDQRRILEGIAAKLRDTGQVFAYGENERLAGRGRGAGARGDPARAGEAPVN